MLGPDFTFEPALPGAGAGATQRAREVFSRTDPGSRRRQSPSALRPAERRQLLECFLLAALLHVLLVMLIGNAPGGSARPGAGVGGSLNVTLRGYDRPTAADPPAVTLPQTGPPGPGLQPRVGGVVRDAAQAPRANDGPGSARLGNWAPTPVDAAPVEAAPLRPLPVVPPLPEPAPPPTPVTPAIAQTPIVLPPIEAPASTAPPVAAPPIAAPTLVAPPVAEPPVAERPATEPPIVAVPEATAPVVAPPVAGTAPSTPPTPALPPLPALAAPAPIELPQVPLPAPAAVAAPPKRAAEEPATAEPRAGVQTPTNTREAGAVPGPAQAAGPDAGPTRGHDVATPPAAAASTPAPLNLQLARPRGGELSGRIAPGALPLLPRPPERPSKLATDIENAARRDCRTAHAGLGLIAAVPLAADALSGSGCKW